MIRKLAMILLILCINPLALADTSTHRKAAEEVLILTKVDKMIHPTFKHIEQMQMQQLERMNMPQEAYTLAQKYLQKVPIGIEQVAGKPFVPVYGIANLSV